MANGFDWEGLTAKPIELLTTDEKLIVLIGEVRETKTQGQVTAKTVDTFCKEQCKKNTFFNRASLTVIITVPALFTALILLFTVITNHIGK
jgi:hypothetical protein